MRDALSILASATVLPPSATPSGNYRRRHRHSTTSTTTKPRPNHNPKQKPQFPASSPLLSSSRWANRQSLAYYTKLASKLAEDGKFDDFLMIAESVVASGVNISEFLTLLKSEHLAHGVVRLLRDGKLDRIFVTLFNGIQKLGVEPAGLFDEVAIESLKAECRGLLKCGELERLVSLIEMFAGFQFIIKELVEPSEFIKLCITKRDPTAAIRYAQNFPHAEVLFCSIILEFGKKRDLDSALKAFEASKQILSSPNMHAYRTIIDVCGLCGDYLKSRAIYEGLLAENITPNIYVFNSLMNVNSHDLSYTLGIYKKMETLGMMSDITSHNILLKSCCLAAKVELAQDTYKQIRELESKGVLKLDDFTYSTIIKVFADAKMWKQALEIKEDMLLSGIVPNTITWSSLISACANAGLLEKAIILFDEMLQAGAQPNTQCFNTLLHACVEVCQFDRAFRLFQCWKERGSQQTISGDMINHAYTEAVDQMTEMGVPLRLCSHLTMRVPFRPTTSTYNIMMKACGTDYYRAKDLMEEMKTFNLTPNHISWSILIDVCGGSGNVLGALQILTSMRESGVQPDVIAYTTAIKFLTFRLQICVKQKKPKLAFKLFKEMKKYQIKPNMVTYNTILRDRNVDGSLRGLQHCLAIYQQMRKAGYKPNDHHLKQLIEDWCEGVLQTERRSEGQYASHITDFGHQSLLLEKVTEYLQDSNAESLFIDLRGLTKVEARIVVLAVIRKIKEKCAAGKSIKDDLSIILEQQRHGDRNSREDSGVGEAVIRLLKHDLALEVIEASSRARSDRDNKGSPTSPGLNFEVDEKSSLAETSEYPTRRPIILRRLKATKKSLHQWLRRKTVSSKR
ncbi:pentatricopeptide repeat-containing protein At5g02830, chloroplastic-like isoform X1 [Salvia splendens]|uniref:pentatricopeptide repeat-containing protein At5g02830, chloroplastic-like isoform X1 n=1 Tax=Salvia splendens TaxID=180675 RepID=UPI001C280B14|nr:pentatricopeptide repeat-containing protein At5g02830, chloroplastic-like isoform X1 [Salvia splendens]